ncbi:MAG: AMP-binding protein, partial [Bdellovibrionota bacterium]
WLLDLPLFHVGGLSVLTRAFFLDAALALSEPAFSAQATKDWINSGRVQGLSLVPTTLLRLLREKDLRFDEISLILLGGAPAAPALVHEARSRGAPVRLTYGMTEHASQAATEIVPGSGLRALPEVEIQIGADEEILLRSPALAAGTFERGELKPLPLRNGFFPTGDLGSLRDGTLTVLGRASELVISGGKKIYPAEVEAALAKMIGVSDCGVLGLPDGEWGEVLCAAVTESVPGNFRPDSAKAELKAVLEPHQIPKIWILLPSIPRSPSGKILRTELKRLVTQTQS